MRHRTAGLAILLLVLSVVSLAIGGVFLAQGFAQANVLTAAMQAEKATYTSDDANGAIKGVIDTPQEAKVMANILREHRTRNAGFYTELERTNPSRATILNAMTMENALNLAQLGFGVTTMAKGTGAFMIVMGLALGVTAISVFRLGGTASGQGASKEV